MSIPPIHTVILMIGRARSKECGEQWTNKVRFFMESFQALKLCCSILASVATIFCQSFKSAACVVLATISDQLQFV